MGIVSGISTGSSRFWETEFVARWICEWSNAEVPVQMLFWIGLRFGAATFTPAIPKLLNAKQRAHLC